MREFFFFFSLFFSFSFYPLFLHSHVSCCSAFVSPLILFFFCLPPRSFTFPHSIRSYHRVKFSLEGERNRKATVYAEVATGTGEYRYLIVISRDGTKVISIVDRRPAEMTKEERQARVTTLMQDAGWTFIADNEVDFREQARALGDYWLKVKSSGDEERAAAAGVQGAAWRTETGELIKGTKELVELEKMTQRLARGKGEPTGFSALLPSWMRSSS